MGCNCGKTYLHKLTALLKTASSFDEFQKLMLLQVDDGKARVMMPVIEERIAVCGQWAGQHGYEMLAKIQEENERRQRKEKERYEKRFGKED